MRELDFVALHTERIAQSMVEFIGSTASDRVAWIPVSETGGEMRSVLQITAECVRVNDQFAAILRNETFSEIDPIFDEVSTACSELERSAKNLADTLRAASETVLETVYHTYRGPFPGDNFVMAAYRNMAYHCGQINLIQSLGGDAVFHAPENWR